MFCFFLHFHFRGFYPSHRQEWPRLYHEAFSEVDYIPIAPPMAEETELLADVPLQQVLSANEENIVLQQDMNDEEGRSIGTLAGLATRPVRQTSGSANKYVCN